MLWAGLAALLLAAPAAEAGSVRVSGSEIRFAGGSERNDVRISLPAPEAFRIRDVRANIAVGPGCQRVNAREATCGATGIAALRVSLGGDSDRALVASPILVPALLIGSGGRDSLYGGGGNDRVLGGDQRDLLRGGPGADRIAGGSDGDSIAGGDGNDVETGGDGDDLFLQGNGADGSDVVAGERGRDTVSYSGRTGPVAVALDDAPGDGDVEVAEGDDVRSSTDNVIGGGGSDFLIGSSGTNRLFGRGGGDQMIGGTGADVLLGGDGIDVITSRDRFRDAIGCGAGLDSVAADRLDSLARDCERVRRSVPMRLALGSRSLSQSGVLPVEVTCPATAFGPCRGSVVVETSRRTRTRAGLRSLRLASRRFVVQPGETDTINLRFRQRLRDFVRRSGIVPARASLQRAGDSAGDARRTGRTFRLRAPE